jgi:vacuolar-type H+-ATPase subunit H
MMVTARDITRDASKEAVLPPEIGETARIIEEFKQTVTQSLERERTKLREIAERDAKAILAKAYQDAAGIKTKADEESRQILEDAKEHGEKELETIVSQARERAEQILLNAEETAKRDAREKSRKEVDTILKNAKDEAASMVDKSLRSAKEEAQEIISQARCEAEKISQESINKAKDKAKETIDEAEILAKETLDSAENQAKQTSKEALEIKQQAEGELLEAQKKAGDEAALIITAAKEKARQVAENESEFILNQAKAAAEKEALDIFNQSKTQGEKERERIIAEARIEAKRNGEVERSQILLKAKQEAEEIISSAKTRVSVQLEESSRLMLEIQQKMQQVIGAAGIDFSRPAPKAEAAAHSYAPPLNSAKPVADMNEDTKDKNDVETKNEPFNLRQTYSEDTQPETKTTDSIAPIQSETKEATKVTATPHKAEFTSSGENSRTYQGKLKIDIAPPVDTNQLNILEATLLKTPNLRITGKGIMEDGSAWIAIDASKPLPLVEILKKIPSVKDVVGAKSYIIIALRAKQIS